MCTHHLGTTHITAGFTTMPDKRFLWACLFLILDIALKNFFDQLFYIYIFLLHLFFPLRKEI